MQPLQSPRNCNIRMLGQGLGIPEDVLCRAVASELVHVSVRSVPRDDFMRPVHARKAIVGLFEERFRVQRVATMVHWKYIPQMQQ